MASVASPLGRATSAGLSTWRGSLSERLNFVTDRQITLHAIHGLMASSRRAPLLLLSCGLIDTGAAVPAGATCHPCC